MVLSIPRYPKVHTADFGRAKDAMYGNMVRHEEVDGKKS